MTESKPLSWQFDAAAQLYDEVRPRYPEEIVEHIIAFAALPVHARVLEVGCGTGQMTLPFAQRGYTIKARHRYSLALVGDTATLTLPDTR